MVGDVSEGRRSDAVDEDKQQIEDRAIGPRKPKLQRRTHLRALIKVSHYKQPGDGMEVPKVRSRIYERI